MGRVCIIGDVHGMLPELKALLDVIAPTHNDLVVSAGDLVDKGPDSPGVVQCMRLLRESGQPLVLVMGNHEEKHARFRKARSAARSAGHDSLPKMKGADDINAITEALTLKDIEFLDSAVPFLALPEHNALVVHAGILPDMTTFPTPEQFTAMSKGQQDKFLRILRVRHVRGSAETRVSIDVTLPADDHQFEALLARGMDAVLMASVHREITSRTVRPKGEFIGLGQETPNDPFWAEVYDGRFGHVYFGHNPYPKAVVPVQFPHATGLDLGCVFGGRLAAAILEPGQAPRFITVPAQASYATALWDES